MVATRRAALLALGFFFVAIASREVFRLLPRDWATVAWKLFWIPLCLLGLYVARRSNLASGLAELGLRGSLATGLGVSAIATLPMFLTLLGTAKLGPVLAFGPLLAAVVLGPVAEEILFRGYLFRQLYRRAQWSFLAAVALSALWFGLAHVRTLLDGDLGEILGVVAITGVGGVFFAWLFVRWNDNLWVPIGMHALMNACWELFAVDSTAVGTGSANLARGLAVAAAIGITLMRRPPS